MKHVNRIFNTCKNKHIKIQLPILFFYSSEGDGKGHVIFKLKIYFEN